MVLFALFVLFVLFVVKNGLSGSGGGEGGVGGVRDMRRFLRTPVFERFQMPRPVVQGLGIKIRLVGPFDHAYLRIERDLLEILRIAKRPV